ncbi:MAG: PD-(D/E)XK nuclease family protein [Casimicrobiaceae bacterium]
MTPVGPRDALSPPLSQALATGSVVITPNKRLARHLAALYDDTQRTAGRTVWTAPVVLPWHAWLERLWLDVLASGCRPDPPRRIAAGQATYLWTRIVATEALPLLDARGAANLAHEAWTLAHAWGAGGPSWRSWSGGDDDSAVFARWAEDYGGAVAQMGGLDDAQLPDWLAQCAPEVPARRDAGVTLAGFIEFSPQQERLLAALASAQTRIARLPTLPAAGDDPVSRATLQAGATPRDEVRKALAWARDRALANPGATIGIAIEDLESRREEVRALADDTLCPMLQWPGHEGEARPYNLSLGTALDEAPLVAAALDVIALANAPLPLARAAALIRSPHVAGKPDDWLIRARLEAEWLRDGRRELSLPALVAAMGPHDRAFAPLLRVVNEGGPRTATPRAWAETWRAWLEASGWPGERALSSVEWQARGAWDDLLAEFATLGSVTRHLHRGEAVAALVALTRDKVFQPESPPARIQILGGLEAAGLPLDALWVAGLAAECWPPAPRPNPLLPLAWQRERNVPRSTAARELAYAQALTQEWARGAPEVVFSYGVMADDHPRTMSSLVATATPRSTGAPGPTTARRQFDSAPAHETIADDWAPTYANGAIAGGGAGLIAAQGNCPFQAMARYRLRTDTWPMPVDGLSPIERGILVHAALAAFWRDVVDHATMTALPHDDFLQRVDAAVAVAVQALSPGRWSRLPTVVTAGEAARIAKTVRAWLDEIDRVRSPFAVDSVEASRPLALGGLRWTLRLDRIDTLADGGTAIIDYKTGKVAAPAKWFDDRAQEPQLGLYWLAQHDFDPVRPIRAVAYAQLRPGETKAVGLAADRNAWPGLPEPSAVKDAGLADWRAIESRWRHTLEALAVEVREGFAVVAPRDVRLTCGRCLLHPLCRIGAPAIDGDTENGDA